MMLTDNDKQTNLDTMQRCVVHIVDVFHTLDVDAIAGLFTHDVILSYNDLDPLKGRASLLAFITPRYADLIDYQLHKQIRLCDGNTVGVEKSLLSPSFRQPALLHSAI